MQRRAAGLITIIVTAFPASLVTAAERGLPVEVRSGRPIVQGVYLNGNGPYRFLLDTGSQTNIVDPELALSIGIVPSFRVEVSTSNGQTTAAGGRATEVRLGPVSAPTQEFLLMPLDAVRAAAPGVRGVLGQEFLGNFDYLLDLRGRQLSFRAPPARGGVRAPTETVNGRMMIVTSLGAMVLDSGADNLILYRGGSLPGARSSLRTSSGASAALVVTPRQLSIQGHTFGEREAIAILRPEAAAEEGLLPVSTFEAIFVCNSEKYVILNPRER
jgi:hypothetical protein